MKKICIECKMEKELNEFGSIKKSKDGHRNQCKICLNKIANNRLKGLSNEDLEKRRLRKNERNRKYWRINTRSDEFRLSEKNRRRTNHLKRLESDPLYKLRISYIRRLNKCIKKFNTKNINFLDNLGCELHEFKIHIESKFEPWMNWQNYGKYNGTLNYGWDIDHIIPISSSKTETEFFKLCHYTNLQPLCSRINRDIKKEKTT